MSENPVVVTRVGMVTPIGLGRVAAWEAFARGEGRPQPIALFPTDRFTTHLGYEIPDWNSGRFWKKRVVAHYTRSTQFALKGTEECLEGLEPDEVGGLGIVIGTQYSTAHNYLKLFDEPEWMTPIKFLSTLPSSIPTNISITCGLKGISTSVSSSVAGLEAVSYAAELIQNGYCAAVLAGGAEELSLEVYGGCSLAGVLAGQQGGEETCRPLAADRNGFIPGEGSAILLLESADGAQGAGREPLAVLAGSGSAYSPGIVPGHRERNAVGAGRRAIEEALSDAQIGPEDVDAVFSGANGSVDGDAAELQIFCELFGSKPPPIIALKGQLGELMGAFGGVAAALATLALFHKFLPGRPPARRLDHVLIHDYSCEGNNAALVLRRFDHSPPRSSERS